MNRTHNNGCLHINNVNEKVQLIGWVSKRRNFGALVFIDLRDRYGITQLVFDEVQSKMIVNVRNEFILQVSGIVQERKDKNPKLKTGDIEVVVESVKIINEAKTTPLIIQDDTDALEDTRLQYRYLDLRRPVMQQKLMLRHAISKSIRNYLDNQECIEIETPILGRSTPEGARDYLVPSRVHAGCFYALPQSPQLFKQLLMISGMERYYQFARCFRDEDLRADRQSDFTQIDIEMSFLDDAQIQAMMEDMIVKMMKEVKGIEIKLPFQKLSYQDAMNKYGSDKPDNRFGIELNDLSLIFNKSEFKVFADCLSNGGCIKAIVINNAAHYTRKEVDAITDLAKKNGAKGLVVLKYVDNAWSGSALKFLSDNEIKGMSEQLNITNNDLVCLVSDTWECTCNVLGVLRNHFGEVLGLVKKNEYSFLWVVDFPMFEYNQEDQRYYAKHHPFTRVCQKDEHLLETDPAKAKAIAYDMVCNGYEIGGGSLRIYDPLMQEKVFEILGFSAQQIKERFGFFIDAFQYGTPPHGGIAFGLDRIAMILSESDSIRDVIAFPKNANAKCMMSEAPNTVDEIQLDELHINLK